MIHECDKLVVNIVDDAYVDMLTNSQALAEGKGYVRRYGLNYHFMPDSLPVKADGGICLVVDVYGGGRQKRILVDGAYSADVVLHNMKIMGIDPASINMAILSHGHPDHMTGLAGVIAAIGHPVPLYMHPDSFIPRSIVQSDGYCMDYINRALSREALSAAGARIVELAAPLELAPGFMYTGQIEHSEEFEHEVPKGRVRFVDGMAETDNILDDVGFVCNIKGKGLLVTSMCGHAGIISIVNHCRKITGVDRVFGVMGGFHLGHAAVSAHKINTTVERLKEMNLQVAVPMHCSGMITRQRIAEALPQAYIGVGSATVLEF
jgi:7,8-dihydropterin-6-yl-methyl-4-(beta-D-ribofuranosyl)aminobenzene 5'-phosphate synthase